MNMCGTATTDGTTFPSKKLTLFNRFLLYYSNNFSAVSFGFPIFSIYNNVVQQPIQLSPQSPHTARIMPIYTYSFLNMCKTVNNIYTRYMYRREKNIINFPCHANLPQWENEKSNFLLFFFFTKENDCNSLKKQFSIVYMYRKNLSGRLTCIAYLHKIFQSMKEIFLTNNQNHCRRSMYIL